MKKHHAKLAAPEGEKKFPTRLDHSEFVERLALLLDLLGLTPHEVRSIEMQPQRIVVESFTPLVGIEPIPSGEIPEESAWIWRTEAVIQ